MTQEEKIMFDRQHIWHPYSGTISPRFCLCAKSAEGVEITTDDGNTLIDGISSWWCMAHGHRRSEIIEAMTQQLNTMPHVMFGGFTHEPVIELTKKLLKVVPAGLEQVFYSDSGSVAVEVAMKMALQYFYALEQPKKCKFLTVENSYHGDTFGTMPLTGDGMHKFFSHALTRQLIAPAPPLASEEGFDEASLAPLRACFEQHHSELAGFIIEPILQGAGGMRVYPKEYLAGVRKLCSEFNVLLIIDEIATGFGRLGSMFASQIAQVTPDIMCVGKALTGGHITMAATLCCKFIANAISNYPPHALMHGPTFMANPLACSAAVASLKLFDSYDYQTKVANIEQQLKIELAEAKSLAGVKDVRVYGAMGALEMESKVDADKICYAFSRRGCWISPFGNTIYTMPPFIITSEQLHKLTSSIIEVVREQY